MSKPTLVWLSGIPLALVLGCSSGNSESQTGAGGSASVGGASSTGGQTSSVGGTTASVSTSVGGSNATGGTTATGTTLSTGGSDASTGGTKASTGGAAATGGSKAGTGGKSASTGGSESTGGSKAAGGSSAQPTGGTYSSCGSCVTGGSSATGGSKAPGGSSSTGGHSSSTGGLSSGGAGGVSPGGASSAGGSTSVKSAGCGIASPLKSGNFTESIDGTSRKWMLDVPSNYDGTKPYRLIFVWHPLGGSGSGIVSGGFNGLKSLSSGSAIFATADGLNGSNGEANGTGWWNANGGDMKLVQIMLDKINAGLCVDQQRIFTTGFSFGGMMSYTLPFVFDVFRATAPCSGKEGVITYTAKYSRAIPIMAFHGNNDTFVLTSLGKAFFEKYRSGRNHCGDQTKSVNPSPCVQYQGCDQPTTWCEFSGGHNTWDKEPQAIWDFFSQF